MTSPIQNIPGTPDLGQNPSSPTLPGVSAKPAAVGTPPVAKSASAQDAPSASDASTATSNQNPSANLRLVIEDDKAAGCFVYKIVNRVTGEIVQQTPQEQIVKLRESDGYLSGDVIKAQA